MPVNINNHDRVQYEASTLQSSGNSSRTRSARTLARLAGNQGIPCFTGGGSGGPPGSVVSRTSPNSTLNGITH
jgi:hypothetical protein